MGPVFPARVSYYQGDGMAAAAHAMQGNVRILDVHAGNIANYGVPGYQRQTPIVRRFMEYLGASAIEASTSEEVGRIRQTGHMSDMALETEGYFQRLDPNTGRVSPSRDGRTQVDQNGYLRALDGTYFVDTSGQKIQFKQLPKDFDREVQIAEDGSITQINQLTGGFNIIGQLNIVSSQGTQVADIKIRQGFVEDSNVMLAQEYSELLPVRRYFEANSQTFKIQNQSLSRMVQELGRAQ